jgi:serine/threonine-protein kinase
MECDSMVPEIISHYQILTKLGAGGMGEVYLARDTNLDRKVAVKFLQQNSLENEQAKNRFIREARVVARLDHPNICAVYEVDNKDDSTFIVMQYIEGENLADRIRRSPLELDEIFDIATQVIDALAEAHSCGIIHRDIKPHNIMLTSKGKVKVLDFGLAKLVHQSHISNEVAETEIDLTSPGLVMGTVAYLSPEQALGETLDGRSDIFSFGILLYEITTGRHPFKTDSATATIAAILTRQPPPLSRFREHIPPAFQEIISKALAKRKELRYQTAMELASNLKQLRQQLSPTMPGQDVVGPKIELQSTPVFDEDRTHPSGIPQANEVQPTPIQKRRIELMFSLLRQPRLSCAINIAISLCLLIFVSGVGLLMWKTESGTPSSTAVPSAQPSMSSPVMTSGMVRVPGGRFAMGTDASENPLEKPEHQVLVDIFFIDQFEVTLDEYYRFIKETGYSVPRNWSEEWKKGKFSSQEAKLPVTYVSWFDAKAYAEWAGKRLPTEAEWEYAARGTDRRLYPWGNEFKANSANLRDPLKKEQLSPVASYPRDKSPFGVYDLAGNVSEWTDSDAAPYPGSKTQYKPGKIVRGGSFAEMPAGAMTTTRHVIQPNKQLPNVGFRCAKSLPR